MSHNGHALADVTRKVANIQVDEDAIKRVRDAQWVEPQKFDYNTYNAGPREKGSAVPAAEVEANPNEFMNSETNVSGPIWATNAMKYEWSEEYGDVGPRHEGLEKMLFHDEHKMNKGNEFKK